MRTIQHVRICAILESLRNWKSKSVAALAIRLAQQWQVQAEAFVLLGEWNLPA